MLAGANDLIYTVNGVENATVPGIVQYINMTMTASYAAGARKYVVACCQHSWKALRSVISAMPQSVSSHGAHAIRVAEP